MEKPSPSLPVRYLGSYHRAVECPLLPAPEYAFIGRSNVGKSSMINYLTGVKEIARTSRKPGKTQSINLFSVDVEPSWIITDLPGYGYAKVSKTTRKFWSEMIEKYILHRKNLMNLFLLIDFRHPPQEVDTRFIEFLGQNQIPFTLLFTKSDLVPASDHKKVMETYRQHLFSFWEELPPYVLTSSATEIGRDKIMGMIEEMNSIYINQSN